MTFAEKILQFNSSLLLDNNSLPKGIEAMNPFQNENSGLINKLTSLFYHKYYNDNHPRKLILGINPGRLGAGATGIPFTDSKRLSGDCNIPVSEIKTHEPSSVFVYEMINAFGGPELFYKSFYISSISPLGFVKINEKGNPLNFNYYDRMDLQNAVLPFILRTIRQQLGFGIDTQTCFCLGTGKNFKFLKKLNEEHHFFEKIVPLEHPRYIMQYKSKKKHFYIEKYLRLLQEM
jgi:hypothetical protein